MPLVLEIFLAMVGLWAASHALHAVRGRPLTGIDGPIRAWFRRAHNDVKLSANEVANLLVWGIRHDYYRLLRRLRARRRKAGTKEVKARPKLDRRDDALKR